MYSLQGLTKSNIEEIYKNVVIYSIKNYQVLPDNYKNLMENKYKNALELKEKLGIIEEPNYDLVEFLKEQKSKVQSIKEQNQPVIDEISKQVLTILKQEMPPNLNKLEKCEYIFDYVTKTMSYSNDWHEYCNNVPPINGYDFDFYQGVPLSMSYEGLLVTRQGICEDISNLIVHLGRELGVDIEKENCYYLNNSHAINYLEINDKKSYIDATNVIRGIKTKEQALLVSKEELDENIQYTFKGKSSSIFLKKHEPRYNMDEIIQKINLIMPTINYIEEQKLEK